MLADASRGITLTEALAELDALDTDVDSLKLTEGDDTLFMVLVYEEFTSQFSGKPYQVATVRMADESFKRLTIGAAALRGAFSRLLPVPGEWCKLRRLKDGEKAHRFRLRVLGRSASTQVPSFGEAESEREPEPRVGDGNDQLTADKDDLDAIPF